MSQIYDKRHAYQKKKKPIFLNSMGKGSATVSQEQKGHAEQI